MEIKQLIDETFQDYKKPSMLIASCFCNWKCLTECNLNIDICQNSNLSKQDNINISAEDILKRYISNPITKSIVFGGLEPMLQYEDILDFIKIFRKKYLINDDIVIYTGYYPNEIKDKIKELKEYSNIIIKFGRYIPNKKSKYDEVLGINLISDNQFALKIS